MDVHPLACLLGEVVEVGLVRLRDDDRGDPRAQRPEQLLLDATDREDSAAQGDFAGHGDVVAHFAPGQRGDQRRGHGDARRGTVLGDGAGRDVDVHVAVEHLFLDVQPRGMRARVGPRGTCRLLHHIAQLAGQDEFALAAHGRRLDKHDVATLRRVVHPGRRADLVDGGLLLGMQLGPAEQIAHHRGGDVHPVHLTCGDLPRGLPRHAADLALQLPDARLASVALHQFQQRRAGEGDLLSGEAVGLDLPRHQVLLGDGNLLRLDVPRELHDFHPVEQRPRNVLEDVGGRDEHHFAQVERHPEVVIGEGVILRRVEHFEQRRGRVALEGDAQLVDLVEQEDRVAGAGLLHPLDDAARHGAHIGAAVTADVRFVPRAAERDADVLPPHRAGDALGHRGLADARRADEEEDRRPLGGLVILGAVARG